jgi:hypothetical protein
MPFETGPDSNPRINSARMGHFTGQQQHVRLPCKVLNVNGLSALVETSDGGQVTVKNVRVRSLYARFSLNHAFSGEWSQRGRVL